MGIFFTDHSEMRIKERFIKKKDVKLALENPDYNAFSFDGKTIARKKINGKILEIIYTEKKEHIVIITAYYLEK